MPTVKADHNAKGKACSVPRKRRLECPAGCRRRACFGRALIADGIASEVVLSKQEVRFCRTLDDSKEGGHARNLFSLFGQEPVLGEVLGRRLRSWRSH